MMPPSPAFVGYAARCLFRCHFRFAALSAKFLSNENRNRSFILRCTESKLQSHFSLYIFSIFVAFFFFRVWHSSCRCQSALFETNFTVKKIYKKRKNKASKITPGGEPNGATQIIIISEK